MSSSMEIEPSSPPPSTISSPPSTSPQAQPPAQDLYTTFSQREKYGITLILGITTITSPLTATIYFPLLPLLRTHFHTSAQAINLTITIYIVFQALSPLFFATLSDTFGRRPIFLVTLLIYLFANLGLALQQHSYVALLILRALQSFGASAAFAVSYGVVADVCVPSDRGNMVGPISAAQSLGLCIGPVVGGWVAWKSGGYGWVFWVLVIVAGVLVVVVGGFLPETARNVVGNGRVGARRWWIRPWCSGTVHSARRLNRKWTAKEKSSAEGDVSGGIDADEPHAEKKRFRFFDFLTCLRIIFYKDSALILWMHGWFYLVDYSIQTALPSIYRDTYHFNALLTGLAYLPRGAGIITGGYLNGKLMDRKYRLTAASINHTINPLAGDNLDHFPIEIARSRDSWHLFGALSLILIAYGWAIEKHAHVSIPLVLQYAQGFLTTCLYTIFVTLLVDVFPDRPSTAAAAASVVRCSLAASGVAALQPLLDGLGSGWYFTGLALVSSVFGFGVVFAIQRRGRKWRSERRGGNSGPGF
ncbi:MAG: hypothetical protein Q9195_001586 [Heterodermia aff. obscurata]